MLFRSIRAFAKSDITSINELDVTAFKLLDPIAILYLLAKEKLVNNPNTPKWDPFVRHLSLGLYDGSCTSRLHQLANSVEDLTAIFTLANAHDGPKLFQYIISDRYFLSEDL